MPGKRALLIGATAARQGEAMEDFTPKSSGRVLIRCSEPRFLAGVVAGRAVWTRNRSQAMVVHHDRDLDTIAMRLDDPAAVLNDLVIEAL